VHKSIPASNGTIARVHTRENGVLATSTL
jgi:hypothetical protein